MVSPNLLQAVAETRNVAERGPLAPFAEFNQSPHDRLEGAKIQRQEKPGYCRRCDSERNGDRRGQQVAVATRYENAESRQDKDHQAHNLDKYVDENACEHQTAAEDSHFGDEPRSDDVAADESDREQRIYRLANKPNANEGKRRTSYGRFEEKPPSNAGRREREGSDKDDEYRSPSGADHGLADSGEPVIGRQTGEKRQAEQRGERSEELHRASISVFDRGTAHDEGRRRMLLNPFRIFIDPNLPDVTSKCRRQQPH
jgi:hypothetical protein